MGTLNPELKKLLGIETNIPKMDWYAYGGIIATPPKFGKTTLARLIPKSVLLACEVGYDSLTIDVKRIKRWEDFVEFIDLLEEHIDTIGDELKLIVVDTVHELWRMCNQYTLNRINMKLRSKGKTGVETLEQYDYRNGLRIRDEEFIKQRDRLKNLGLQPLWMSHLVKKKIKPDDEESYHSLDLDYDENLYNILVKDASYVLIGQNIREVSEDGKTTHVNRKFVAKNDGVIQGGSRVHIGEDIYFDTEEEFLEKFNEVFSKSLMEKNNIKPAEAKKMVEVENKELVEKRKAVKVDKELQEELVKKIKGAVSKDPAIKKKVLSYLDETYSTTSAQILNELDLDDLKQIEKLI